MDLDKNKPVCGTCKSWGGKRECIGGGIVRVGTSAKGNCEKLDKAKISQGGCNNWEKLQSSLDGGESFENTDS